MMSMGNTKAVIMEHHGEINVLDAPAYRSLCEVIESKFPIKVGGQGRKTDGQASSVSSVI